MKAHATKIGATGLVLWAFAAFFNSQLSAVPVFEILTIALGIGFLSGLARVVFLKSWSQLKQPIWLYLLGFIGVFGNELLYVSAFKFAPASHIILINYLWPILVVILAGIVFKQTFSWRYFGAALLGFGSVAIFLLKNEAMLAQYWIGYLFAFFAACCWCLYVLMYRASRTMTAEMLTCYCGMGFILSLFIHLQTETFYLPSQWEWISLIWLGGIGMCIAFNFWNFGIKNGNIKLLSVLSYNNIILSSCILTLFGENYFDLTLMWSMFGLVLSYVFFMIKLA